MWRWFIACALVACSGPTERADTLPPVGVVRFDAWPNPADLSGGTSNSSIDPRQSGTFQADFNSRAPIQGFANYGTGVNAQAREDQNILYASANGVDFWSFLCIIPPEIYHGTPDTDPIRELFSTPFSAYRTSQYKSRMKFMLILQAISLRYPYPGFPGTPANTTDGGAYLTQWGTYVAGMLNDPQYLVVDGKPQVGMYSGTKMPDAMWATFKAAVTAAGGPAFDLVDWNHDSTTATRLGAASLSAYPPNPGLPSGNGQHTYQEQDVIDTTQGTFIGFGRSYVTVITSHLDQRPLSHNNAVDAVIPWIDQPSQVEWYNHVYRMIHRVTSGFSPKFSILHSWNEYAEDGQCIEPTTQEGTRRLDGVKWARNPATLPSAYTYSMSPEGALFTKVGSWTMTRLLATTAHDNRAMTSGTLNDTLSFTHIVTTAFALYGDTALAGGTFNVQVDGGAATPVSTVGSAAHHQLLWSSGALAEGTHTVLVTILGTGSVSLDALKITCNPSNFPAP